LDEGGGFNGEGERVRGGKDKGGFPVRFAQMGNVRRREGSALRKPHGKGNRTGGGKLVKFRLGFVRGIGSGEKGVVVFVRCHGVNLPTKRTNSSYIFEKAKKVFPPLNTALFVDPALTGALCHAASFEDSDCLAGNFFHDGPFSV
jgi:hypothetical protein